MKSRPNRVKRTASYYLARLFSFLFLPSLIRRRASALFTTHVVFSHRSRGRPGIRRWWDSLDNKQTGWKTFYGTEAWKKTRKAYASSVGGICERCAARGIIKAGEIVHHKKHLSAELVTDPALALSWDNLELLCRDCHAKEHEKNVKRYKVDELGRIIF